MPDFTYEVDNEFDYLIEEKGNTAIYFRRVSWGGRPGKLELRKWRVTPEGERADKGFSFLTDEGPHELARILTETGFGKTDEILESISKRDDFGAAVKKVLGKEIDEVIDQYDELESETFYDPKSLDLSILE